MAYLEPSTRLHGKRFLLVFHSFGFYTDTFAYMKNLKNLGVIPPINLLYVGAWLKRHGAEVELMDCHALSLTLDMALEKARGTDFDFLCFTAVNLDFLYLKQWLRAFGKEFKQPILVGGVGAKNYPEEVASLPEVTSVFHSPAEVCIVEWAESHMKSENWWQIPGTCSVYKGKVYNNPPLTVPKELRIPLPARELLPDKNLYFSILSELRPFTAGMSLFGCPFACDYCSNRLKPFHQRSAIDVVDELEICEKEFGYKEIDYFDANFSLPPERVFEVSELYQERKLSISWSCRLRTDQITENQLKAMKQAHCSWIGYGIESGDEGILSGVNKSQGGVGAISKVLAQTRKAGIGITGFFVLGLPGETEESLKNTLNFIESNPFDFVQISPYWPVPGTPVYERIVEETGVDIWKSVITGDHQDKDMSLHGTEFSLRHMHEYTSKFYREFYFRPSQVLKILRRTSNWGQFRKYATAGVDVFNSLRGK
jgi:anaerobic magnesium-protoporphyrin IX monomethyl ester cyclase